MTSSTAVKLQQALDFSDGHLDEDLSVALTSLITSAVREQQPLRTLRQVYDAIETTDSASYLEPLTLFPLLVPSKDESAYEFIKLMTQRSSAKEMVMAAQEVLENIETSLLSDDQPDGDLEESSAIQQIVRLLGIYSASIPRLPKRTRTPSEIIEPLFRELDRVVSHSRYDSTATDRRALLGATSKTISVLTKLETSDTNYGAEEHLKTTKVLFSFLISVLETCANDINAGLAQIAFERQFPRLVLPTDHTEGAVAESSDLSPDLQTAMASLQLTSSSLEKQPTLGSLILLAHLPSYHISVSALTTFFPIIITSLQSNLALDEVLSLLIDAIVPFRATSPAADFPPDLLVPLVHILPSLASVHPEPATRHHVFRLLSSVLQLAPSSLRLQLLQELLTDSDTSPQMQVAAVGLVKNALLESLSITIASSESSRNVFASPLFLRTFGPIVLQTHPPDLFDSRRAPSADDFLEIAEPLRLVECLALYYVWLLRDVRNRTGVRDSDNLRNVERTLLEPLRQQLKAWDQASDGSVLRGEDPAMQLAILDMWLGRISDAIEKVRSVRSNAPDVVAI